MKPILILFACVISVACFGQTNGIIFPELMSSTNTVLMTNAEFRCYSGDAMFFKSNDHYQIFHAKDLAQSVLDTLHTSADQLESKQRALDEYNRQYKDAAASYYRAKKNQEQSILDIMPDSYLGSGGGEVYVNGYYRASGTYVHSYARSAPSRR